ncbi:MAG: dihydrolipoyl dehydrogenase family protein [Acidimicrobiales bacterium]
MKEFDLVVVGGGTGGLSAVRSARWAGKSAALISQGEPGGDCTFTGCVPSKALISVAARGGSFAEAMHRVRSSIDTISVTESMATLRQQGIEVIDGRATMVAPDTVDVDGTRIRGARIVIATGAQPVVPTIPGLDQVDALTNENIFDLSDAPQSLAVLGAGPVGCELAQALARLGVEVTVFEALDRVLAREEPRASAVVQAALEADGVSVRVGQPVVECRSVAGGVEMIADGAEPVTVERVLVSVGRRPSSQGMGLQEIGVELDQRGHIQVDGHLRTAVDGVYAVGDVTGLLPFTHAADEMGRLAAGHALGFHPRWKFDPSVVPWATFTDPEVARIGPTEAEAATMGGRVAELSMSDFDRAITDHRTEGFIKIITGPKTFTRRLFGGRVIGATVVGPRAGETINELALAVRTGMFTGRLGQTVHAYPTWGFAIPQTVAQFFHEVDGRRARPARADGG